MSDGMTRLSVVSCLWCDWFITFPEPEVTVTEETNAYRVTVESWDYSEPLAVHLVEKHPKEAEFLRFLLGLKAEAMDD